jgi:hypothetical protein
LGTNAVASTTAWTNFLAQNIARYTNGAIQARKLTLVFSTSLSPEAVNGLPTNPFFNSALTNSSSLFGRQAFGAVIYPYVQGGVNCAGVQVNLLTATNFFAPAGGIPVLVRQSGTSTLRNFGYCNPNNFLRCFNFDPFQNLLTASFNGYDPSLPGSSAFSNRSIANDLWTLVLDEANGSYVTTILDHLDWLVDIQFRVGVRFYTDSCQ